MAIPAAFVGKALVSNITNLVGGLGKSSINGMPIIKRANTAEENAYLDSLKPAPVKFGLAKTLFSNSRERAQSFIWTMGPNEWLAANGVGNRSPVSASGISSLSEARDASNVIEHSTQKSNNTFLIVGVVALIGIIFLIRRR